MSASLTLLPCDALSPSVHAATRIVGGIIINRCQLSIVCDGMATVTTRGIEGFRSRDRDRARSRRITPNRAKITRRLAGSVVSMYRGERDPNYARVRKCFIVNPH
jgi:hypothetical protein